jgi:hypothetical protein
MKDSRTERAEHTAKVAIVTGGGSVAANLGACRPVPGQAEHADAYFTQAAGRGPWPPARGNGQAAAWDPMRLLCSALTDRCGRCAASGETSDKKPMRLIGTRTVGDSRHSTTAMTGG